VVCLCHETEAERLDAPDFAFELLARAGGQDPNL
jgi:hypothetical protein